MKITHIYKRGDGKVNEDAFVINESNQVFAVIDGATGLTGIPGDLASYAVRDVLGTIGSSQSLLDLMKMANEEVAQRVTAYYYKKYNQQITIDDIKGNERSSTGLATIQIADSFDYFNFVHAGDCMLFLQYENGDIRTVTYDLIQYLDSTVIAEMVRIREQSANKNWSMEQLRAEVAPMLITNRNKLNKQTGYGIIDGTKEALNHLEYGKISLKRVKKVLLLSDGLDFPVIDITENSWQLAAEIAFSEGLENLLEIIERKEAADPNCERYPRLKQSDDKTGILLEF